MVDGLSLGKQMDLLWRVGEALSPSVSTCHCLTLARGGPGMAIRVICQSGTGEECSVAR